jgi:hypothetical protein
LFLAKLSRISKFQGVLNDKIYLMSCLWLLHVSGEKKIEVYFNI